VVVVTISALNISGEYPRKNNNHRFRRLREQLQAEMLLKLMVLLTNSGKAGTGFTVNAW